MRLHEITSPTFFIANKQKLPLKAIISGRIPLHPLGANLELSLEARRPDDCTPRDLSIYLHQDQPTSGDYVYEVRPIGQVDCHHTAWLEALRNANPRSEGEVDQFCRGYWSGKELPERRDLPWEYRAAQITVLRRAGGSAID